MSGADLSHVPMLELFRAEVEQQTAMMSRILLSLEQSPATDERLDDLMRAAHSIKGAARLVGRDAVVRLAHRLEDLFVASQADGRPLTSTQVDAALKAADILVGIAIWDGSEDEWQARHGSQWKGVLAALDAASSQDAEDAPGAVSADFAAGAVADQPADVPRDVLSESLTRDRTLRISAHQLSRLMALAGESMVQARWLRPYIEAMRRLKMRHWELATALEEINDILETGGTGQSHGRLMEVRQKAAHCRELLEERLLELEVFDRRAESLHSRLQAEVISSRMRPFRDGVHTLPRVVRDVARMLGKRVRFTVTGLDTMVDRDVLERVEAPLSHLLQNAIDHGIESPEERGAIGKPPEGQLRLDARHQAGKLMVTVEDDGRGIDFARLRKRIARSKKLKASAVERLSDNEVVEFLFLPGFSTKEAVTDISGRGVGLDVVRDVIEDMRGSLDVVATPGQGMRFQLCLPLTLSVVPALLLEIAGETYAIALARIGRILRMDVASLHRDQDCFQLMTETGGINVVSAARLLELADEDTSAHTLALVVLGEGDDAFALAVDRFADERNIVVHPLPPQFASVEHVSAAALDENGSPILILDVDQLTASVRQLQRRGRVPYWNKVRIDDGGSARRVLVADDSITVRELVRKLLQAEGYRVDVAVDGVDAWSAVRSEAYDLVITDIDMPRMDGIELVRRIKGDQNLADTPVMVLSFKDSAYDRSLGRKAGADAYLAKASFHDNSLCEAVVRLIGEAKS